MQSSPEHLLIKAADNVHQWCFQGYTCQTLFHPCHPLFQAIGRVHRIGQTRESHVHRFIMQESIEVAVANLCQKRGEGMDLASPAALSKRGGAGGSIGVKGAGEGAALSLGDITSLLMGRG